MAPKPVTYPPAVGTGSENPLLGILFMCLAVALFPVLNASVKLLSADYNTVMVVWARYAGHLFLMLAVFFPRHGPRVFRTQRLGSQVLRSLLLFGSTSFYFTALIYLPLTTAATISFTAPFIVTALSPAILGERVGPRRWIAVLIGFTGALVIIRPGMEGTHWAALLVVASAGCYALYQLITRKLAGTDSGATTITFTALVGAFAASIAVPFFWQLPVEPLDWLLFFACGFFGGFGHLFVVKSLQYAEASLVTPITYAQLIGATIFGYFLFGDFPDAWTWTGAGTIVACGIYIGYRERRRH